jgi:hypothetical protein
VTTQGSARTRFNRAVERRNIFLAELSAREMGFVDLEAALALASLYAAEESPKFDKAATRLLARLALERPVCLSELLVAAAALADLSNDPSRREVVLQLVRRRPT